MGNANASFGPLLPPTNRPVPQRLGAQSTLRSSGAIAQKTVGNKTAKDLESLSSNVNQLYRALSTNTPTLLGLDNIENANIETSAGNNSITWSATADTIVLSNGTSTITLDPSGPSITLVYGAAPNVLTLTLANGVINIIGSGTQAGHGTITIDGLLTAAAATLTGLLTAASAMISGALSAGAISAASVAATGAVSGATVAATGVVSGTGFTASGNPGVTVTATVRNAAGTGTSTQVFTDGILTGYTP